MAITAASVQLWRDAGSTRAPFGRETVLGPAANGTNDESVSDSTLVVEVRDARILSFLERRCPEEVLAEIGV